MIALTRTWQSLLKCNKRWDKISMQWVMHTYHGGWHIFVVWYFKYAGQSYLVVGYHGLKQNGKDFSQLGKHFRQQIYCIKDEPDLLAIMCSYQSWDQSNSSKIISIPYNQNYWQALYLTIYSKNAIDRILHWQFWVLCGNIPMVIA